MIVAFASGFVVFLCEVLWVHLIGAVLGMSTYAFAVMLSVVLFGLAVGAHAVASVTPTRALSPWVLPAALVIAGGALGLTAGLWDNVPAWLLAWGKDADSFLEGEIVRFAAASLVILPAAVALGAVYPSLLRQPAFPLDDADAAAGVLGAANAIGSCLGALIAGFVLIAWLGSEASLFIAALLLIALGAIFGVAALRRGEKQAAIAILVGAVVAIGVTSFRDPWNRMALTSGAHVYFTLQESPDARLRFFHEDTFGGMTTVVESPPSEGQVLTLLTNGKFQGNDSGEIAAQVAFALVPATMTTGRDEVLVIGLGTGVTAAVLDAAGAQTLEVAEIAPGIVEAARAMFTHVNGRVLDKGHVATFLEDGRNHLLRTDKKYALISMELSSVWFSGVSSLYSTEFYALAREHLADGGVLQQWIQLHHLAPEEIESVIATLRAEFPHVSLWRVGGQGVLVATMQPQRFMPELGQVPALAPYVRFLEQIENVSVSNLESKKLLDDDDVTRLAAGARAKGVPLNTDRNRWLEYRTPRHALEKDDRVKQILDALLEYVPAERRDERRSRAGAL